MNEDHADAIALYATVLLTARKGAWRVTGIDPDGIDLALGDDTLRAAFPGRRSTAQLRYARSLAALARQARE